MDVHWSDRGLCHRDLFGVCLVPLSRDPAREDRVEIDRGRWAPVFNAYHVPYRIGISTFGRIARRRVDASGRVSVHYLRDASPIAFARRKQLARSTRTLSTGEVVVRYDVLAPLDERPELQPGDVT